MPRLAAAGPCRRPSSPSFDVSLQEIFSTWCSGGALYCIGEEDREDFSRILRYLAEHSIERIFLPYVALQQLAEVADGTPIPGSYWGECEAGLVGGTVHARADTPVHSLLHEAARLLVMPA